LIHPSFLALFFGLLAGSILLFFLAAKWSEGDSHNHNEILTIRILSYIGFAITFLYLCLLVVMRKRILLAVGIVKESARALAAMPALILMPVCQALAVGIFLVPWAIYSLYLASSGEISTYHKEINGVTTSYRQMDYNMNTRYAFLYLLFCWYWTSEFILAVGQLISATSISAWYFTRDKKAEGNTTVIWVTPPPPLL
jgi:hypothetical protein